MPAALLRLNAWPTPGIPSTTNVQEWIRDPLTTGFLTTCLQTGAWLVWAVLAAVTVARAYTRLAHTRRWLPALQLPGPMRGLTAALLGATAVTTATAGIPAHAAASTTTTPAGDTQNPSPDPRHSTPTLTARTAGAPALAQVAGHKPATYTVGRGDTLSDIAQRCLGDADRWPDIFALNRGTHFPSTGGTLRDPDVIYPGWALRLPTTAAPGRPPSAAPAAPSAESDHPDTTSPNPGATAPAPTPASTTPTAPATPTTATSEPDTAPSEAVGTPADQPGDTVTPGPATRGVSLPGGSWVDVGLALAITAAAALVWAHRRRRYVPRTPSIARPLDAPDLASMPRVVGHIRRGLHRATASPPDPDESASLRDGDHHEGDDLDDDLVRVRADANSDSRDVECTGDDQVPDGGDNLRAGQGGVEGDDPLPVAPALDSPLSALWPPAGLGLTGPGAHAATRGLLTAALASGGVDHPDGRTDVVIPSTTAATLLGAAAPTLPRTPRLTVTAGLDEALDLLEAQTLHRTRLTYQHEVNTIAELRRADPFAEPLPPVMLIADANSRHERARVAALLAQGQRLDIHGVLLGDWPDGDTIAVAADGTTTPANDGTTSHGRHAADVGRLAVLDPVETSGLLVTLAESYTGQPQPSASTAQAQVDASAPPALSNNEERMPSPTTSADRGAPDVTAGGGSEPDDVHGSTARPPGDISTAAAATPDTEQRHGQEKTLAGADGAVDAQQTAGVQDRQPQQRPLRVRVLGRPGVDNADPQRSPRAKSLELLVYLAVHDGAASTEAILDDLLPDAPTSKAPGRLYTYVSGLRAVLRHNGGPGSYVTHPDHRYLLHRDCLDVDLWRMRAAIREAARATDPQTRTAALRRAVDAYTGPLAEGCDYEWVESYREAIRQDALDAHLALADALAGNPAQQVTVLDTAITHHPHCEALYQQAMRARAELGHLDAIRALRRQLTRALAEIDAEPSDDTLALADRLATQIHHTARPNPATTRGDGEIST
ncbi:BTAD domain-containing putative transcriptional regulator [Micromonospora sp. ZYX-F-536]|uniref:BTAD domain-containing putative transcriptional regulator n=1 Tax=Micromonospora sp. ZYX-F-536 TaxID=3457629 RepID=UPI004040C958